MSILVSSYLLSCVVRYEMSDSESDHFPKNASQIKLHATLFGVQHYLEKKIVSLEPPKKNSVACNVIQKVTVARRRGIWWKRWEHLPRVKGICASD